MKPPSTPIKLSLALFAVVVVLAIADLLVMTISVLLLVFAGLLFGIFLHSIASWFAHRTSIPYRWNFSVVVLVLAILMAAGIYYLGAQAVRRADNFYAQLQSSTEQAFQRIKETGWLDEMLPDKAEVSSVLAEKGGSWLPELMVGMQWIAWAFTAILVIVFVGLYGAYDPKLYETGLLKIIPMHRRDRTREVLAHLRIALGSWLIGRLISMSIIGIMTAIGLWLLGIPMPVTLGVVAALLTFIPNIGPIVAAFPQVLLALNIGTNAAIYVVIFNLMLQGLESYIITPIIQRAEVTLPPILTIAIQLLLGVTIGIIGVAMAAPLLVVAMVLVQSLYVQDRLGDQNPGRLVTRLQSEAAKASDNVGTQVAS